MREVYCKFFNLKLFVRMATKCLISEEIKFEMAREADFRLARNLFVASCNLQHT